MKILLIDNYDSFTYNIVHIVKQLGYSITVVRNDQLTLDQVNEYDKLIFSPGPGIPSEAGLLLPIINAYAGKKSMLGVCLGHQAIAENFGATLINLAEVFHGVASTVLIDSSCYLFEGIGQTMEVGRYHSWSVTSNGFPSCLKITATDSQGSIMALSHQTFDIQGVQFHPESVLTPKGEVIIRNFLTHSIV